MTGRMSMTRMRIIMLSFLVLVSGTILLAQKPSDTHPPGKNPHLGNKASLRGAVALYRVRCGDCHGLDATGLPRPRSDGGSGRHDRRAAVSDHPQGRTRHRNAAEHGARRRCADDHCLFERYEHAGRGGSADRQRRRTARACSRRNARPVIAWAIAVDGSVRICRESAPRDRARPSCARFERRRNGSPRRMKP